MALALPWRSDPRGRWNSRHIPRTRVRRPRPIAGSTPQTPGCPLRRAYTPFIRDMSTEGSVFRGNNAKRHVEAGGRAGRSGVRMADAWVGTGLSFCDLDTRLMPVSNPNYVRLVRLAWSHSS